jgi:hypothetical protein
MRCEFQIALKIKPIHLVCCDRPRSFQELRVQAFSIDHTRPARHLLVRIIPIRPQHALAHARITGEIRHRDSLQAERPRSQQVKSAVPRKIVNARGCLEEDNRRAIRMRFFASHFARHGSDLEIIEPADKSAFDALGEEFFHPALPIIFFS